MEQIELFIVYLVIGVILVRTGVLSDKDSTGSPG